MTQKSISLFFKSGNSNKEYHIQLEKSGDGFVVNFQYGRVGNALQSGTKTPTPVSEVEAEKIYAKLEKEKRAKGYDDNGEKKNDFSGQVNDEVRKEVIQLPQLLNTIEEDEVERFINDDDYVSQEKKDGERRTLISFPAGPIGLNKKGQKVQLPNAIIDSVKGLYILDGEIINNTLFVFDTLAMGKLNYRNAPLVERLAALEGYKLGENIVVVETAYTTKDKRAMFERLKAENREGIVFKKKNAPYTVGRPSSGGDQFKFKFQKSATFIVKDHTKGKRSVGVELIEGENRVFMGKCTVSPNHEMPSVGMLVEVQYLYAYKGGAIFQPVYKGERLDSDLTDCTIAQIVYKAEQ